MSNSIYAWCSDYRVSQYVDSASKESDVLLYYNCLILQAFAENLFNLFDTDGSGSVSLQELMGGMGRLLR